MRRQNASALLSRWCDPVMEGSPPGSAGVWLRPSLHRNQPAAAPCLNRAVGQPAGKLANRGTASCPRAGWGPDGWGVSGGPSLKAGQVPFGKLPFAASRAPAPRDGADPSRRTINGTSEMHRIIREAAAETLGMIVCGFEDVRERKWPSPEKILCILRGIKNLPMLDYVRFPATRRRRLFQTSCFNQKSSNGRLRGTAMKAQTMNAGGTDQACSATAAGWKTIASRSGSASTRRWSPECTSPLSSLSASGSWMRRWRARLSGRAP